MSEEFAEIIDGHNFVPTSGTCMIANSSSGN